MEEFNPCQLKKIESCKGCAQIRIDEFTGAEKEKSDESINWCQIEEMLLQKLNEKKQNKTLGIEEHCSLILG